MKPFSKFLHAYFLSLLTFFGYAQTELEWAPIGAEWHYQVSTLDQLNYGFEYIKAERDTALAEGKDCKVFEREFIMPWGEIERNSFILCESNGLVEHYLEDQFYTLYHFNAQVGDKWTVTLLGGTHELPFIEDASGEVSVDSITIQEIEGVALKKLHLSLLSNVDEKYLTDWIFFEITEIIGSNSFLFPKHNPDYPSSYLLNCYSDQNITYKNSLVESECNEVFTSLKEVNKDFISFELFPNPCNGLITLSELSNPIQELKIYSILGQQVAYFPVDSQQGNSMNLDLSFLSKGIYYLSILPKNSTTYIQGKLFSIVK